MLTELFIRVDWCETEASNVIRIHSKMARIWEKWRNFIAFLLTILTIFLSPNCQAATHWIVTENGRIEQQASKYICVKIVVELTRSDEANF